MRNKFINGAKVCAHLKNLFTKGGADSVNNYADYINKQSQKKKLSLERIQELNEISLTISWWKENVMKKLDRTSLQEKKHQQESKKEQRLISYFVNNITSGKWTLDDIKSEAYRELVKDYFEASPFGLPQNNQALVMADSVQETVMTMKPEERVIEKELHHYVVRMTDTSKKSEEELNIKGLRVTYEFDAIDENDAKRQAKDFDPAKRIVSVNEYVNELPEGFEYCDIQTAPRGYRGASNGKSFFSGERITVLVKEQSKPEEKTFSHGLKVGDVLYASWGYDQTNLDFFVIVSATEKTIRIKECTMEKTYESSEGYSSMSRMIAFDPKTAKPLEDSWMIKDQKGKGDIRKIQYYEYNGQKNMYIKFRASYGLLQKYEGTKLYESWYA